MNSRQTDQAATVNVGRLTIYADGGSYSLSLSPALARACALACGLSAEGSSPDGLGSVKVEAYGDRAVEDVVIPYLMAARRAVEGGKRSL